MLELNVGDVISWGEDEFDMTVVSILMYDEKDYIILKPTEIEDDKQFVIMRIIGEHMISENSEYICESILSQYLMR